MFKSLTFSIACLFMLLANLVFADTTYVSGPITGRTVWDTAGSPYIVTGDIQVSSGDTLEIQPGVTVLFTANADDRGTGNNGSRCEIYINNGGFLDAQGTVADSIFFRSFAAVPVVNNWEGVVFYGQSSGVLAYCHFAHANTAVYIAWDSSPDTVTVRHCAFEQSNYGVYAYYCYYNRLVIIDSNVVQNMVQNGLYLYTADNVTVTHNFIDSTGAAAIYYGYSWSGDDSAAIIANNVLTGSGPYGIYGSYRHMTISGNTITGFNTGVFVEQSPGMTGWPRITHNTITGGQNGMVASNSAAPLAQYNSITGQSQYQFVNYTSGPIDARRNWWGAATTDSMAAGAYPRALDAINDQFDNAAYGPVHYFGWLDAENGTPVDSAFFGTITLTNNAGVPQVNYTAAETLYVTLNDTDENTAAGAVDTVRVLATSTTETAAETLTLIETGVNTAIFAGSITLEANDMTAHDGVLQAMTGDQLTAVYRETRNGFGVPDTLADTAAFNLTPVSGPMASAHWTAANSPYLVTGDVMVPAGETLTIDPGVEVRFLAGRDDQAAGFNTVLSEIMVNGGTLTAVGMSGQPIVFTSQAAVPTDHDWFGIVITNNGQARIERGRFRYAQYGVYGSSNNSGAISVRHCDFDTLNTGVYLESGSAGATCTVDSSVFHPTASNGVYVSDTRNTVVVTQNRFDSLGSYGMVAGGTSSDSNVVITANTLTGNNNGATGIYCSYARPKVTYNTITNYYAGINCYVGSSGYATAQTVAHNTIMSGTSGVTLSGYAAPTLVANNIFDQGQYQVLNQSTRNIDARYNYWGGPATDSMNAGNNPKNIAGIYDKYDNAGYGTVYYFSWLDTVDGSPLVEAMTGVVELRNGAGTVQQCFHTGDTAYVRITDMDMNISDLTTETLTVYLTSTVETSPESLRLPETDPASSAFAGFIVIDSNSTAVADGQLQAVYANTITARYQDPRTAFGVADTARTTASFIVTRFSGNIVGAVRWMKSGNPYIVTGDVIINSGNSLAIDPGVQVFFTANSDDRSSGSHNSRGEFYVNGGRLIALGSLADSILFTSTSSTPATGDWQGIYINNSGAARVAYATFRGAYYGIYSNGNYADSITIRHSRLDAPYQGLYLNSSSDNCVIVADSNRITRAAQQGVYLYGCDRGVISHTVIDSAGSDGIYLYSTYNGNDSSWVVANNTIIGQGNNYGIAAQYQRPAITGNTISNYSTGIYCYMSTTTPNAQTIDHNTITGGNTGVQPNYYANPTIQYNNIYGQTQYQVYNQTAQNINARYNYWGPAATTEMNAGNNPKNITGIIDYFDNSGYGRVNYSGWLDTVNGTPAATTTSGVVLFVNQLGAGVAGYAVADSARVRLTDADVSGSVTVYLTSETETTPEALILAETGSGTGVFTGTMALDSGSSPALDGRLQAISGDYLTAVYHDAANDFGFADTARGEALYGVTVKSGHLAGKVTWTKAGGPYLVTGDIIISTNDTLVIEPGATVLFAAHADNQRDGGDNVLSEIWVSNGGRLLAEGSETEPIVLTSAARIPATGDWFSIYIQGTGAARLAFCDIRYAANGVYANGTSSDSVVVQSCVFTHVDRGLYISSNSAAWRVEANRVSHPLGMGIEVYYARNVVVTGNVIDTAGGDGIYVVEGSGGNDSNVVITGNTVTNNGNQTGINVNNSRPAITGNTIRSCYTGIQQVNYNNNPNAQLISHNTIVGGYAGVYLYYYAQPQLEHNNLYGQSQYQVYNQSYRAINAQQNYWGETTTAAMEAGGNPKDLDGIYDQYEGGSWGAVDYMAWLDTVDGIPATGTMLGRVALTNAGGTAQYYYLTGETAYVQLTDADLDVDGGAVDTARVLLTSTTETAPETLVLLETGSGTGIFRGGMALDSNSSPAADGKLQGVKADFINAAYPDQADNYGRTATVNASALFAPTQVSGAVSGTITWTQAASPYLVTGDVSVTSGNTLLIEPGVVVYFKPNSDDRAAGTNSSKSEIYVNNGTLTAMGTSADSIFFRSIAPTPVAGDWQCIYAGYSAQVRLAFASIAHANNGIYGNQLSADSLVVKNSNFNQTGNGVYVVYATYDWPVIIDSCRFSAQTTRPVIFEYVDWAQITRNVITNPGNDGIYLNSTWHGIDSLSTIAHNTLQGQNANTGININYTKPSITHNVIDNFYHNVSCYGSGSAFQMPIEDNTILNGTVGIYNSNQAAPAVHRNTIIGQSQYQVDHESSRDLDARNNWWGTTTTAQMAMGAYPKNLATMYDRFDNAGYGAVYYFGWLDTANGTPVDSASFGAIALVDAADSTVLFYNAGDSLIARVLDPDENTSATAPDSVAVLVTSATETAAETLVLTETGVNTGVFRGGLALENAAVAHDGKLQTQPDDMLFARYFEARNGFGVADTLAAVARYAIAPVSGALAGKVTWTQAGGPYLVTGDVQVGTGDTLVIEPGTKVYFQARVDDQAAGRNTALCEIDVNGGVLQALGTVTDSIIFTSYAAVPATNDWYAINFRNNGTGALAYCHVWYPYYGVYGGNLASGSVAVTHSRIDGANYGVAIDNGAANGTWLVDSVHVQKPGSYGVYTENTPNRVTVSNCWVDSSGSDGIYIYGTNTDSSVVVVNNTLRGRNNGSGISCYYSRPRVSDNTIINYYYGIYCYTTNSSVQPQAVTHNTITGGYAGIYLNYYAGPTLQYNNLTGQSWRQVVNQSYKNIDARYNYWGPAATTEMNGGGNPKNITGIYDKYDNAGYGTVYYYSWLDTVDGEPLVVAYTGVGEFLDGLGATKQLYRTGDTAYVRLTDADRNANSALRETVTVYLTSNTETVPETLRLPETDTASGVFGNAILLDSNATPAADHVLQAVAGNILGLRYQDPLSAFGIPDTARATAAFGYTRFSGNIAGAVRWTRDGNPYVITGDVIITSGNSLTIDPGVQVFFTANSDDRSTGSHSSRSEFYVNGGRLIAVGTAADSILFTSTASTPVMGDWQGIYLNSSGTARVAYTTFRGAYYGLYANGTYADSVVVRHSRVENPNRGLYVNSSSCAVILDSNRITKPAAQGIYLGSIDRAVVTNTVVDSAMADGIYLYNTYNGNDSSLVVANNTIIGRGSNTGIYTQYQRPAITGNTITNYTTGIYCYVSNSTASTHAIDHNTITGGTTGIQLNYYANPAIQYNSFISQLQYQVNNQSYRPINARYNYWGEAAVTQMETGSNPKNITGIYDYFDNNSYGQVDYANWLDTVNGTPATANVLGQVTLTNAAGTVQYYYLAGETAYVRVSDRDENYDTLAADTTRALVRSTTETTPETLLLVETGANTGVFAGWIAVDSNGTPVVDGRLQAVRADRIYADYRDTADSYGRTIMVTTSALFAPTRASGPVSGNVTWTKAQSPYIVTGDVSLNSGTSLTIEPGVVVYFKPLSDDRSAGNNSSRCEIYLNSGSRLTAVGTPTDSIIFTSIAPVPTLGDWENIYTYNGAIRLAYCHITAANNGVYSGYMGADSVVVRHCRIDQVSRGLYFNSIASAAMAVADSNWIYKSTNQGIYIGSSDQALITNNRIDSTGGDGIYINSVYNGAESLMVVTGNRLTGRNSSNGIYCYRQKPAIRHNTIDRYNYGVYCNLGSNIYSTRQEVFNNTITNGQYGVYLVNYAVPAIRYNTITGQSGYQVYNQSTRQIDARHNWWGAVTTAQMADSGYPANITGIYDWYENNAYGRVQYFGWLDTAGGTPVDTAFAGAIVFTNGTDSLVLTFKTNDTAYVRVTDGDENHSAATVDTLPVLVTSTTEAAAETLRLLETGVNTAVFRGGMALVTSGSPSANGTLEVQPDDIVQAAYREARNGFGQAETLKATARFGLWLVSGPITGKVTWTQAGGPYLVTGDVQVETGDTLVIEPGTRVYFQAQTDDRAAGQNTTRSEIWVNNGVLIAAGTAADSIIFTSYAAVPAYNDWYGITVMNSGTVTLDYCHLSYPYYGVYANNTNRAVNTVRRTRVDNVYQALYVSNSSAGWTIDSTWIYRPQSNGIYLGNVSGQTSVTGCRIDSTGNHGIYLSGTAVDSMTMQIVGNTVLGMGNNYGIITEYARPAVLNNTITNWYGGIYCYQNQAYPTAQPVRHNTITGGQYGVYLNSYAAPLLHNNNLWGQSSRQIYNQSYRNIDARYNYWGPAATTEMNAGGNPKNITGIYDKYDNASYGTVYYYSWLDTVDGEPLVESFTGIVTLADSAGAARQCFHTGDTAFVRVADPDQNTNPAAVETVTVYLTSTVETTPEVVRLAETDSNTGVFSGRIALDSSGTPTADGELQAVYANTITARYQDPLTALGMPDTVRAFASFIVTRVSGPLTAGTTRWTKSGNPYIVTGDVMVGAGATLLIDPGVQVYFTPNQDDRATGRNSSRCEIYVNGGRLVAQGTAADSIRFTSLATTPVRGDWEDIYFYNNGSGKLDYCVIDYAQYGVCAYSAGMDSVTVRHSRISNSAYGVYANYTVRVLVDSTLIVKPANDGIYLNYVDWARLTHNLVDSAGSNGINISSTWNGMDDQMVVTDNILRGRNNGSGVYCYRQRPLIARNTISNHYHGVYCELGSAAYPTSQEISHNTITGGWSGFRLGSSAAPTINFNNIDGQTSYRMYNQSTRGINARFNWWGATTTAQMDTGNNPKNIAAIYDWYENNSYGRVNYSGWLDTVDGAPACTTHTGVITLTNRAGAPQPAYRVADTAFVRLTEADDRDPAAVETLTVLVRSTTETEPETISLTETGAATGVFTGYVLLDSAGTAGHDGVLQAKTLDRVYALYADPATDFGLADTSRASALFGVTPKSGNITGRETWTQGGGPYFVTGDILVNTGDTLVLEPGVQVYFTAGADDQANGNNSTLSEIYVWNNGRLLAQGSAAAPIVLASAAETPQVGDWFGISFNGTGAGRLDYVRSARASYGVYGSSTQADSVVVRHSRFDRTNYGIYQATSYAPCVWVIDSNYVNRPQNYGIYSNYGLQTTISGNLIDSTGNHGIYVGYNNGNDSTVSVVDNTLLGTGGNYGIYAYNQRPAIVGNRIINYNYGLNLNLTSNNANPQNVAFNTITGGWAGIMLNNYATPQLRYNSLSGQTQYQVYNQTSRAINAQYNFWGNTTLAQQDTGAHPRNVTGIYDFYESSSYGRVDYANWLTMPVPGSHAPVVVSANRDTATEDVLFEYAAAATHRDSGVVPAISFTAYPAWLAASGDTLRGTPLNGDTNTTFLVLANDGTRTDTLRVRLRVVPVNDAPVITSAALDTATEDVAFEYVATATDVDNVNLSYVYLNRAAWMVARGCTLTGTPTEGLADTTVRLLVSDGSLTDTLDLAVHVQAVNDPPQVVSANLLTTIELVPCRYVAQAIDPDNTPVLSFAGLPAWLTADGDTLSGTPPQDSPDTTVLVIASDGSLADTLVLTITTQDSNTAPMLTSATTDTTREDVPFSYVARAVDAEGNPLTLTFEHVPAWLTVDGDTLSGTSTEGMGDTSFTVIATDGYLADTQVVVLTVQPVNDAPELTSSDEATATEDLAFEYVATATDVDNAASSLVFTYINRANWMIARGCTLLGTPTEGMGDTSVLVIVSDGVLQDTLSLAVTVLPVNDAPVLTSGDSATAFEDMPFTYAAGATDIEGDDLYWTLLNAPAWLDISHDTVYGTAPNGALDTVFTIVVDDDDLSDTLTVGLRVVPMNDAPVLISADQDTAVEDVPFVYVAQATDEDNAAGALIYTFVNRASWMIARGCTLTGTPREGDRDTVVRVVVSDGSLSDEFVLAVTVLPVNDPPRVTSAPTLLALETVPCKYVARATDPDNVPVLSFENVPSWMTVTADTINGTPGLGTDDTLFWVIAADGEFSDTQVVLVTVADTNSAPEITSAAVDTAVEDLAFEYITRATDAEANPISFSYSGLPAWLSVTGIYDDTLRGTPLEGEGNAAFTIIAVDGYMADTQVVTLVVRAVNDAPVLTSADQDTAVEDVPFMYVATATDPDNAVLTYQFIHTPAWLTMVAGDSIGGTLTAGTGDTSFMVIVSDGSLTDTQVVQVHVVPVNDPPQIVSAALDTATENMYYVYQAVAVDPDNMPVFAFRNLPSWLTAAGDSVYGTAPVGAADTSFTILATDGALVDTQVVTLVVVPGIGVRPVITRATQVLELGMTPAPVSQDGRVTFSFAWTGSSIHYMLAVQTLTGAEVYHASGTALAAERNLLNWNTAGLASGSYIVTLNVQDRATGRTESVRKLLMIAR